MAAGNFDKCHAVTAKWEGGWSNHPDDPGGATMYGVIQTVYDAARKRWGKPKQSVRKITHAEALRIFKEEYWDRVNGDNLAPGVDLATYDAGVNSGVGRARQWLSASVGGTHAETAKKICAARLRFVRSLRIFKTFGKGWTRRIADVEAKSVAWALAADGWSPANIKKRLQEESTTAENVAKTQGGGAAATGVGGGGVFGIENLPVSAVIFVLAVAAIAGFILLNNARINVARSKAYRSEAAA